MSGKIPKTEFEKMLERKAAEEEALSSKPEQPEDASAPVEASEAATAEEAVKAQSQLDTLQAERDQLKDQLLRARAEFDNYRKRTLRDMEQNRQSAAANLIRLLLPVLDNLERALAHANEDDGLAVGVRMVHKQLLDTLTTEGLEPIPARGMVFDPTLHDAVRDSGTRNNSRGIRAWLQASRPGTAPGESSCKFGTGTGRPRRKQPGRGS